MSDDISQSDISISQWQEGESWTTKPNQRYNCKIEAIKTLSGAIIHEFNNILGIIIGNADMALDDIPDGNPARESINDVLDASNRARYLIQQLVDFTHQANQEFVPLAPETIIRESAQQFKSTLPATIRLVQDIHTDCGTIQSHPVQLQQLLMHLCSNAVWAMNGKGTLTICGKTVVLSTGEISHQSDMRSGSYFQLSISDTGIGMDPESRKRIFRPFFTTRKEKNSGMGLTMVLGIVKNHGGTITINSEPGKGSTFHVFLPLITESTSNNPLK